MSGNTSQNYLQQQYNLLKAQSNNNTNFQVEYINNNTTILVSNLSESEIVNLKINTPRYGMIIYVQYVKIKTNISSTPNQILTDDLNESISLLKTNKSYGQPFQSVFGSSNYSVNAVADITSNILNINTENMIKTYKLQLIALPLSAVPNTVGGVSIKAYTVTGALVAFGGSSSFMHHCGGALPSTTSNYIVYYWNFKDANQNSTCLNALGSHVQCHGTAHPNRCPAG